MFFEVLMVSDFFKKLHSEFLEQKLEAELELKNINIKLNENQKFIQKLKEEDERNFNAFSPRKQNSKLKDNIKNLKNEQELLLKSLEEIQIHLDFLNQRLSEFDTFSKELRSKYFNEKEKKKIDLEGLKDVVHKLEFCVQLIQLDPNRCKLELMSIIKMFYEIIENFNIEKKENS